MEYLDERINSNVKDDAHTKVAKELVGIGPVTASAVVTTVGDFNQFKNGAQLGAWLGLTPRQNSSAEKMVWVVSPSMVTCTCAPC